MNRILTIRNTAVIIACRTLVLLAVVALSAPLQKALAQSAVLTISSDKSSIEVDEIATITVSVTLSGDPDLNGVQFNLNYDTDQFTALNSSVLPGAAGSGLNFTFANSYQENNGQGTFNFAIGNFPQAGAPANTQNGTFEIAELELKGVAANNTPDLEFAQSSTFVLEPGAVNVPTTFNETSVEVTEASTNQDPNASFTATPMGGTAPVEVDFNASASSDSDGSISNYAWDFGDGNNGSGVSPSHTYQSAGNFTVTLTVTDNDGATDTETKVIVVSNASAKAAVLSMESDKSTIEVGETATITISINLSGDPNLNGIQFDLGFNADQFTASGNSILSGAGNAGLTFALADQIIIDPDNNNPSLGIYQLALANLDFQNINTQNGEFAIAELQLTGKAPNGTPNLTFIDPLVLEPGAAEVSTTLNETQVEVTAQSINQNPTASFTSTPMGGIAPVVVMFDASASTDSDGNIVSYAWDFGDGNSGNGISPDHTYQSAGSFTVVLTVTDNEGAQDTENKVINVTAQQVNTPPAIDNINKQSVTEGQTVSVTITADDDDDDDITLGLSLETEGGQAVSPSEYSFVDNGNGTAAFTWITETGDAGNYTATVTAEDDETESTAFFDIMVMEPIVEPDPEIMIVFEPNELEVSEGETFTVTAVLKPNQPVDVVGAQVFIGYDNTKLSLDGVSFANGANSVFSNPIGSTIDEANGTVLFGAVNLGSSSTLSSDLPFVDVTFTALDMEGETTISFADNGTLNSKITNASSQTVPAMTMDATVTITDEPDCDEIGPSISVASVDNPQQCGLNGTINLSLTNVPDGSYTITYDGGEFSNVAVSNGSAAVIAPAGTYADLQIMIGICTSEAGIDATINEPAKPTLSVASSNDPATCGANGTINFSGTNIPNGTYNLAYSGGVLSNISFNGGNATVSVPAGDYQNLQITVNGCTSMEDVDVNLADPGTPSISVVSNNATTTCNGEDGSFVLNGLANNASYLLTYFYNGTPSGGQANSNGQGQIVVDDLTAGIYSNITVATGECISNSVSLTISEPAISTIALGATVQPSNGADNGSIQLTNLSPSGTYQLVQITNGMEEAPVVIQANGAGAYTVTGLGSGSYGFYVTQAGCQSNTVNQILTDPSQVPGVSLALDPEMSTVNIGETFTLDLIVQPTNSPMISAISAYLDYDDTYLEAVDFDFVADDLFTFILREDISTPGEINFAAGTLSPQAANSEFVLYTVTFEAKQPIDPTNIEFAFDDSGEVVRLTKVTIPQGGQNILNNTTDAQVTIQELATINGQVSMEGRTDQTADDLVLRVYLPNSNTQVGTDYNVTTDANGNFSVSGILAGTYDIWIKKSNFLAVMTENVVLQGGNGNFVTFNQLLAGDADGNNAVSLLDYNIFFDAFGTAFGSSMFDERTDYDGSGYIFIEDFTLWSNNFGRTGAKYVE